MLCFKPLVLFVLLAPGLALACEPTVVEHTPYVASATTAEITDTLGAIKPVIVSSHLSRGGPGPDSECGSLAYLTLQIALPAGAPFRLGDVGTDIRRTTGNLPSFVLSHGPVMPYDTTATSLTFTEVWGDPPARQEHLHATFEITFVGPDGTRSKAQTFKINSWPKRTPSKPER